jgi:hypothetical protein
MQWLERIAPQETNGYIIGALIRSIQDLYTQNKSEVLSQLCRPLFLAENGPEKIAILRVHTSVKDMFTKYLPLSLGDPAIEALANTIDAEPLTLKESTQLVLLSAHLRECRDPPHICISKINDTIGEGVFATTALNKGDIIGVYSGILELVPEKAELFDNLYLYDLLLPGTTLRLSAEQLYCVTRLPNADQDSSSITRSLKGEDFILQVNAKSIGNYTRYINHSSSANVQAECRKLPDGKVEIILTANQKIQAGEQLLLDYGKAYWKSRELTPCNMTPTTHQLPQQSNPSPNRRTTPNHRIASCRKSDKVATLT